MMTKLVLLGLVFLGNTIFCQDMLYLDNDTKLQVKILEKNDSLIKFKKLNHLDGPTYSIQKKEITLIVYSSGEHEVINKSGPKNEIDPNKLFIQEYWRRKDSVENYKINSRKNKLDLYTKNQNIVFSNIAEFANLGIGIDFVREEFEQRLLLFGSLSLSAGKLITEDQNMYGFNSGNLGDFQITKRPVIGGVGLLLNTGKRKFVSFNAGPIIKFGQYDGTYYQFTNTKITIDSINNIFYFEQHKYQHGFVINKFMIQLQANLFVRLSQKINIMIYCGGNIYENLTFVAGNPSRFNPNNYNQKTSNWTYLSNLHLGLDIGYRFNINRKGKL